MESGPRLRDLGRWCSGGTPPKDRPELWEGDVPWISGKDFDGSRLNAQTDYISRDAARAHAAVLPSGALVLLVRGMALVHGLPVALIDRPTAINQDVRGVVLRLEFEPRFVHYAVVAVRPRLAAHIDRAAHGTARFVESGYDQRLADPRMVDQAAVADFLDRECERIGTLSQAIRELAARTTAEMRQMIDGALTEDALGCGRAKLSWYVDVLAGYAFPSDGFVGESAESTRLLRGINVGVGTIRWEESACWPADGVAAYARWQLSEGDLVLGMDRPWISGGLRVAEVGRADLPALLLQRVARLRSSGPLTLPYVRLWLERDLFELETSADMTGVSVPHISPDQIGRYRVAVPTSERQRHVVCVADAHRSRVENLTQRIGQLGARLTDYRDALITEAVTGKLDVARLSDAQLEESARAALEGEPPEVLAS